MVRQRRASTASNASSNAGGGREQELGSMYDYLAKVILLGPSGSGKSCLLHRFVKNEWRILSSHTIGVEFASKIVKVGSGSRRKRVKLQLWDTAGTERFRSVSRSYYRGAAGALLVYDLSSRSSFRALPTFLNDARALTHPDLTMILVANKTDVMEDDPSSGGAAYDRHAASQPANSLLDSPSFFPSSVDSASSAFPRGGSIASGRTGTGGFGSTQTATVAPEGREVPFDEASRWASAQGIPVTLETSALSGDNVDEVFSRLARMILTKIELGEIDPDDPSSGIQYGDSGWGMMGGDGGSVASGRGGEEGGTRRRGKRGNAGLAGLRDWEEVFRIDKRRGRGNCC